MEIPELNRPTLQLEEVWNLRSNDDRQNNRQLFLHHFMVAINFLRKSSLTSVLSVLCIATVLSILGIILAFQQIKFLGFNGLNDSLRMSIFLKDEANATDSRVLEDRIKTPQKVKSFERLSKGDALAKLQESMSAGREIFSGLEQDNPLPASYELTFPMSEGGNLASYAETFKDLEVVDSVAYDGQVAVLISKLAAHLQGPGSLGIALLVLLAVFLIATTVRLSLFHEMEQIEIMGLVGAYPAFIRAPFVIGGAIQGSLGFVISLVALGLIESRAVNFISNEGFLSSKELQLNILSWTNCWILLLLAMGAGVVGSYLSARSVK